MKNDYKTLELNLISAENLQQVNHISKMRVYAVVSVSDDPKHPDQQKTDPDRVGGCNPKWNSTFRYDVPAGDPWASLRITLRTEHALGDRDVGRVSVPIRELLAGDRSHGDEVESVRLRVRDSRGNETDGVVNFSYRILPGTGPPAVVHPPEMPPRGVQHNGKSHLGLLMLEAIVSGLAGSPV